MRSAFDDITLIHDKDEVRVADGGQAVGNDEARSAAREAIHRLLHEHLGSRIDRACGLVENYHRSIFDHCARNGQQLALACRKAAAVVKLRIVALGQRLYVVVKTDERTKGDMGMMIPVVITVYSDRSFTFITKTPPAALLIKKACGIETASGVPQRDKVATISKEDLRKIAEQKMPDLNCTDIESAMSMIAGTCRSMGVLVGD